MKLGFSVIISVLGGKFTIDGSIYGPKWTHNLALTLNRSGSNYG